MPRSLHYSEPNIINQVVNASNSRSNKYLEIATGNKDKLREIESILKEYKIVARNLNLDEVQSLDHYEVASKKAKLAYRENGYNPILIEETSLDISGLSNRPGPYVKHFFSELELRRLITTKWLKGLDRSAVARVVLAIFDGVEVYTWVGETVGKISEKPIGKKGFGWDDIFIPKGSKKTFAQMNLNEKNKFSMRRKALEQFIDKPFSAKYPVFELLEPFDQELKRVRPQFINSKEALRFAYSLEPLEGVNKLSKKFIAPNYKKIFSTSNSFFTRFLVDKETSSLGLMLTDVDRKQLNMHKNGNPILWQMGPERRHLALAQRAEYFLTHQNKDVHNILDEIDKTNFPQRNNKRSITIEEALGIKGYETVTKAASLKEIGYKKISSQVEVSRTKSANYGLFNKIGKYARNYYGVGCLPFVSGWRDVITTAAIGHMLVFVHRNNINAIDFNNQINLILEAKESIKKLSLEKDAQQRALRNIGAALGCNPKEDLQKARILYKKAGIKAFRIYTINSDPRVVETARLLRKEFADDIEIFVGQVVDKKQCLALIDKDIKADGLIFGHGGGRQCTSAVNGMALATLEELYEITIDKQFNNTSVLVEGGIGSYVGALMIMGVDCILRNAQFASCVIEQGDLFFEHKSGKLCQPYHGSASSATMIIESFAEKNVDSRLYYSGRTKKVEGKSGYIFYKERANSMSFYVEEFKHYASRTLADLGVESLIELREFLDRNHQELFRLVTPEAMYNSTAYRS